MTHLDAYAHKFETITMARENGILEVTLHGLDGGPLIWNEQAHRELPDAFADIGADEDNRVVIMTGTGDVFCTELDPNAGLGFDSASPMGWDKIYREGRKLLQNLVDIEVPMIAAVNGPATVHAELGLLCDIVLASDRTFFQDSRHFTRGGVPGDGVHVVWPLMLGINRARYFLLMAEKISARDAKDIGFVHEVLAPSDLLPRAREIAADFATRLDLTLRYTRVALNLALRRALHEDLSHGLLLEGLGAINRAAQ